MRPKNVRGRRFFTVAGLLIALAAASSSCMPQHRDASQGSAGVEETLAAIIAADKRSDVEAIVGLYTEDAVLIPPEGPSVYGRDAIRQRYSEGFEQFSMDVAFKSEETVVAGEWAYNRGQTVGTLIWHDDREPTPLNDAYLMIRKRGPDGWLIHRLIWNRGTRSP
ncbi:MAG TPA: nuclear transport factor 2 family protein [Acidobacteriota bacterium]|nr:nuclear transport factor 2 family protein [Acidobacteriota bacterium]